MTVRSQDNEITAPLVLLGETEQARDIEVSKGPTDIDAWGRCKEYVKLDNIKHRLMMNPREWEFDQPFQVASHYTGERWDITNRAFLGQVADCNLNCPWCFANNGDDVPTIDVTPSEYVDGYIRWSLDRKEAGVCRISGGEPLLYQEWVCEVLSQECGGYYWVDTNLTKCADFGGFGYGQKSLFAEHDRVSVCGCLKPGTAGLDVQLEVVDDWVNGHCASLFLYWPTDTDNREEMVEAMDALRDIHPKLPLRMIPIWIKQHYEVIPNELKASKERTRKRWQLVKSRWWEYLLDTYTTAELMTPSHLISIW